MTPNQEEKDSKKSIANAARYSGIGFQLLAVIAVFTWLGVKADEALHSKVPLATAFLSLAGVCLGLYLAFRQIKS